MHYPIKLFLRMLLLVGLNLSPKIAFADTPALSVKLKPEIRQMPIEHQALQFSLKSFKSYLKDIIVVDSDTYQNLGRIVTQRDKFFVNNKNEILVDELPWAASDQYALVGESEPMYHPISGNFIGFKLEAKAYAKRLDNIKKGLPTALEITKILGTTEELTRAVPIHLLKPVPNKITLRTGKSIVSQLLIEQTKLIPQKNDVVLIAAGQKQGLQIGNMGTIFPLLSRTELNANATAKLIVYRSFSDTSLALLIDSVAKVNHLDTVKFE